MALLFDKIEKVQAETWRFEWTGTAPFRIHRNGLLEETTDNLNKTIEFPDDSEEPPALEVLDANDTATPENFKNPVFARIQWRSVPNTDLYFVQQKVGTSFLSRQSFTDNGEGYFKFDSEPLVDEANTDFRVIAVDKTGNQSAVVDFDTFIVRNPDPPKITIVFNSGTTSFDISART